jgi:hypothetical protein
LQKDPLLAREQVPVQELGQVREPEQEQEFQIRYQKFSRRSFA